MYYNQINKFSLEQWKIYRELRLLSLKDEPRAFGSTYEKEINFTEEKSKCPNSLKRVFTTYAA